MNYQMLDDGYVLRLDDNACIPPDPSNTDYQAYLAWRAAGNTPLPVTPPTYADYAAAFMGNFTAWIETVAQSNAYDSALSCASYVTSAVPQFKGDAVALIAWRDALWVWAAQWQAGFNGAVPDPIPTWDVVQAQAPQPATFGWVVHTDGVIIDHPQSDGAIT
jgi:hypothetical protein